MLAVFSAHLREFWEIQTRPLAANEIPALSTSSSPLSRLLGAIELRGLGEGGLRIGENYALGGLLVVTLGITGRMMLPKSES